MAYKKRKGTKEERAAEVRLTALKSFDSSNGSVINYGSSGKKMSSEVYEEIIDLCKERRSRLNTFLEAADTETDLLDKDIKKLIKLSSHFLFVVKARFGEDSTEYDQMGGTRHSQRKKRRVKN